MFLLLISFALADNRWAATPAEGVRWPDVTTVTVQLKAGDEVEVLFTDKDKVRVRKGTAFGWVPAASLTDVAPPKPLPTEGLEGGDEFPTVTVPGGEEQPADGAPADAPAATPPAATPPAAAPPAATPPVKPGK